MKRLLAILLIAASCSGDEDPKEPQVKLDIDPAYQPYVDAFFEEAEKRNITLPEVQLTVKTALDDSFSPITCRSYAIQLSRSSKSGDTWLVEINERVLLQNLPDLWIESVVLREMFHIYLGHEYTPKEDHFMSYCKPGASYNSDLERDDVLDELFEENYQSPPLELNAIEDHYKASVDQVYSALESNELEMPVITPIIKFTYNEEFYEICGGGKFINSTSYKDGNNYVIELHMDMYENPWSGMIIACVARELFHLVLDKPYSESENISCDSGACDNIMFRCNNIEPSNPEYRAQFQ